VKDLYLIKAAQAAPFVETAKLLGARVDLLSRAAGLPLEAVRRRDGVVGERSLWRFIELAVEETGLEHFGYRVALDHPVSSEALLGGFPIRQAPTLRRLLDRLFEDLRSESSGVRYRLRRDGGDAWFHRQPIFRDSDASWQAEQYVVAFIIQIVRLAAGGDWLPTRMRFCAGESQGSLPAEWTPVEVEWGHAATEIKLSQTTLELQPRVVRGSPSQSGSGGQEALALMSFEDLVDRQIWTHEVGLENAAHELGLSPTTLKDRLAAMSTSYSKLVEERRSRWARKLLAESDLPVGEIAHSLGYRHQSNFTRAFVRMSGMTPLAYRREHH